MEGKKKKEILTHSIQGVRGVSYAILRTDDKQNITPDEHTTVPVFKDVTKDTNKKEDIIVGVNERTVSTDAHCLTEKKAVEEGGLESGITINPEVRETAEEVRETDFDQSREAISPRSTKSGSSSAEEEPTLLKPTIISAPKEEYSDSNNPEDKVQIKGVEQGTNASRPNEELSGASKKLEQLAEMNSRNVGDQSDDSSGDDHAYMPMSPKKTKSEIEVRNKTGERAGSDRTKTSDQKDVTETNRSEKIYDVPRNLPNTDEKTIQSSERGNKHVSVEQAPQERPTPKPREKINREKAKLHGTEGGVETDHTEITGFKDQCRSQSPPDLQPIVNWIKGWKRALLERDDSACANVDIPKLEGVNMEVIHEGFRQVLNRDRERDVVIEQVHTLYRTVMEVSEESCLSSHDKKKMWQKADKKQKEVEKMEKKERKRLQSVEKSSFYEEDHENYKSALMELLKLQTIYEAMFKKQKNDKDKTIGDGAKVNCRCYEKIDRLQLKLDEERQKVMDKEEVSRNLNNKCERQEHQIQRMIKERDEAIREKNIALKEKEAALTRLSELASGRLRDHNPGITDLSDDNRPLNLAEKFSELYDNEWTDLFDELCDEGKSEEDAISYLLDILKSIYEYCSRASDLQQENLLENFGINAEVFTEISKIHQETDTHVQKSPNAEHRTLGIDQKGKSNGEKDTTGGQKVITGNHTTTSEDKAAREDLDAISTDHVTIVFEEVSSGNDNAQSDEMAQAVERRTDDVKIRKQRQKVKRFLKSTRSFSLDVVKKRMVTEKLLPQEFTTKSSAYKLYFNKCTRLCWLMQMQEKPIVLVFGFTREAPFSTDFYRHYTKTGTKGDYLVWPAMLLHEGGPLLQKGVIQPL